MDGQATASWWRRRNWWKIGFFVMLLLAEFAREWAVIASNETARIAVSASMVSVGDYTVASGRWQRTDGGGSLTPSATQIECFESEGRCRESNVTVIDNGVGAPDTSTYQATFSPEAINYENNDPVCARYSVRMDRKLEKVFALRQRKPDTKDQACNQLENRIEMALSDGWTNDDNTFDSHFVPVMRGLIAILSVFK
ncbi:hypothetical protein KCP91_12195 [Microvirga sp. SRT01]|uniref:Uncharacterized protein n=1 Tax=Sphingomonas longa TaxID=2778730 RepID=A0ABS2D877_9SPHN|nr:MULTISPECIES: hypothetical protein [Alphaproteobacteria]MBM6577134.1 hypothetical protein [Sphingomonas sp. BT552]MBR7710178.1 hypothetical protein [Microvirga sp. SRT01]